ncbi:MAG: PAS domain-containing sensor histidine kinase [Thaumarchaeota archaeon]|nr:MAG: PAS domain-containing sensor histidine kinase [Nitrososphaerota archaeon]
MNGKSLSAPTKKKVGKLQRQTKPTKKYETPKKELEISSLKKRHKIFYDELPGLLRTIDTDGNIIDCNSEYANTFGYSKKELIGKSVFSFVADEGRQAFQDSFDTWLKTGRVKNKPVWFKKKDGTKFLGLVSASNLYDENGKMIGSNTLIKDITEIHETKSKLEESQQKLQDQVRQLEKANTLLVDAEQKYENLYNKTPTLLRTITIEGILTDCNDSYAKALGYTKEEAIGASIFDHAAERSMKDMRDNFERWKENHETEPAEIWLKRKDGSVFPSMLSGTSLYDERGKLIGRTLALTDMTEIYEARNKLAVHEKHLQQQLAQLQKSNDLLTITEKRYRTLYEKTPVLLRTITTEGILTDCNEAYARALGYTKEEAIGMSIYDHTAGTSVDDMKKNLEQWHHTHEVSHKEIWMKRKDGSIFPSLLTGASIYDESGNVIGRTVALTDMTEIYEARKKLQDDESRMRDQYEDLKKAHDLLTITEKRYRTLYEKTPVLLRTITTEGILTDCNEAYARALGYTKEEAIGMSFYDHTAKSSVEDLKNNLEQWKKTNEVPLKEIWMKRKDGSIFPSLLSGASIFDEYGNVIGRTVALTDMTEIYEARRQLEEKEARIREQYDELKKIDTSKEEFTSMISHELKTPLTPIMGWCQALKSPKILGELSSKQLQALDAIETNAIKLKELVSDMLDAQKLDMKRMKFDNKDVDVTEMMNFLAQNLQSTMVPKHIEFVNSTTEKLTLKSDRSRLEQVLNNIILNAVDFTSAQTGKIEIRAESKDSAVLFMVKDNGIGIPKDKQSHLFTQFYQLDTSATRKHGGSGLGLSICKGIVEALGGEIWVESDTGKGSDFYFTIPKQKKIQLTVEEKTNF